MTEQTIAKIFLSGKTGAAVQPNDLVVVAVDIGFAHDGMLPLAIQLMGD